MPQMVFTDRGAKALQQPKRLPEKPKLERYFEHQAKGLSLMLIVSYTGSLTWYALFYKNGKPRTEKLGKYPAMSVQDARTGSLKFDPEVANASADAGSFETIAEKWFTDHVEAQNLTSKREIRRHLTTYIYPTLRKRPIFKIEREEIANLLRSIEKKEIDYSVDGKKKKLTKVVKVGGRSQADAVLQTIRSIMSWYEGENGKFKSVIVKSLKRDKRKAHEKKRTRALDFDEIREEGGKVRLEWHDRGEIRALWKACDDMDTFGAIVKLLLLTAQRRECLAKMKLNDLSSDGVWTIRTTGNAKGTPGKIKLPQVALDIIKKLPKRKDNDYVFAATRRKNASFNSFSEEKRTLDGKLLKKVRPFRLHDLRRTASSLMAKSGVPQHIAERVLGHEIPGVAGIYNRYDYTPEKNKALEMLADQIELILNPSDASNVVALRQPEAPRPGL